MAWRGKRPKTKICSVTRIGAGFVAACGIDQVLDLSNCRSKFLVTNREVWPFLPMGEAGRWLAETILSRISQMSCLTLAHDLRQPFENKGFDAFHANITGEPNG